MRTRALLALVLGALLTSASNAHYNMLLPDKHSAKKGEVVTFTYQWGHPFEHQLFDAPKPASLVALAPDGKKLDLTDKLTKVALPGEKGKKVTGYQLRFTPDQRGDYIFLLKAAPVFLEEEGAVVEDAVKVVLHVQAQKGWSASHRHRVDLRPLTRPYGLEPGMVFQARALGSDKGPSRRSYLIEVERYNAVAPKKLPPEEHITRTVRTAPDGVVTTTLTDPGWWSLTVTQSGGMRNHGGKDVPLRERCTLWVFVDEKPRTR
jgi:cobalt/nickel transport protein